MAGCVIAECDGGHISEGLCHFGDGPLRAKGLCNTHYLRHHRGVELEGPRDPAPGAKVTEADVRDIRKLHADGESPWRIGYRYGINPQAVNAIVSRRSWAWVD